MNTEIRENREKFLRALCELHQSEHPGTSFIRSSGADLSFLRVVADSAERHKRREPFDPRVRPAADMAVMYAMNSGTLWGLALAATMSSAQIRACLIDTAGRDDADAKLRAVAARQLGISPKVQRDIFLVSPQSKRFEKLLASGTVSHEDAKNAFARLFNNGEVDWDKATENAILDAPTDATIRKTMSRTQVIDLVEEEHRRYAASLTHIDPFVDTDRMNGALAGSAEEVREFLSNAERENRPVLGCRPDGHTTSLLVGSADPAETPAWITIPFGISGSLLQQVLDRIADEIISDPETDNEQRQRALFNRERALALIADVSADNDATVICLHADDDGEYHLLVRHGPTGAHTETWHDAAGSALMPDLSEYIEGGDYPEHMDWTADLIARPEEPGGPIGRADSAWTDALTMDGENMREALESRVSTQAQIVQGIVVEYQFDLECTDDGYIVARGVCRPTMLVRDETWADESRELATYDITVCPRSAEGSIVMREMIRATAE